MTFPVRTATPAELEILVAIDDDASQLFAQVGLDPMLPADHPFFVNERARWLRSLQRGDTFLAIDDAGAAVGFAALEILDGAPYLDQLSVRLSWMRRGLGRTLLAHALGWARARGDTLWLTTYGHLPWNRPFYEKEGFVVVPASDRGPEISARLAEERGTLLEPEQRVAMRRAL
jgi:GNAT superfamily N-acetyltransferase